MFPRLFECEVDCLSAIPLFLFVMFVRTITHLKGRHEVRHSKSKLIIDVNKNAETSSIIKNLALSSQPRLAHLQDLSHWLSPRIYSCDKKTYPETFHIHLCKAHWSCLRSIPWGVFLPAGSTGTIIPLIPSYGSYCLL